MENNQQSLLVKQQSYIVTMRQFNSEAKASLFFII